MSSPSDAMTRVVRLPATLTNLASLAAMLEKLERATLAPDPSQYRRLVAGVSAELQRQAADPALPELLEHFPAAAEIYENMRYELAGLCLSPLDRSIQTEQAARLTLQALMRR